MNALIVRLGALGDIVHAIPAVAALRRAWPEARLDWVVDAKHRAVVDLVAGVDRVVAIDGRSVRGWTRAVRELRTVRYDVAIDLQGLLKSAVLARASGAARVIGFSIWHLREKTARPFYSAVGETGDAHVIRRNLRLLETVGVHDAAIAFPLKPIASPALDALRARIGPASRFALINPGAAWPNKRWPADRFGEVAAFLREACGLVPVVLWGPGEDALAGEVMAAASGAAVLAPPTTVADVIALAREATVVVSGDTGPLHLAVAAGAPIVSVFGPTDPARNGPIAPDDIALSRYDACGCQYDRRCHQQVWCLSGLPGAEVCAAVQRRLGGRGMHG
jgi:lipopolysaccharide heptosyltransferase I